MQPQDIFALTRVQVAREPQDSPSERGQLVRNEHRGDRAEVRAGALQLQDRHQHRGVQCIAERRTSIGGDRCMPYGGHDDVRFLDGLSTPVPDGETVSIIPAVAGG